MLYIQQSLAEDEKLIHVAKFHWMYDVLAVINLIFFIGLAVGVMVLALIVVTIVIVIAVMGQISLEG